MMRMRMFGAVGKVARGISMAVTKAKGRHDPVQSAMAGHTLGTDAVPTSPITLEEFDRLKRTVTFTDEDVAALRLSHEVLADQVEEVLDVWYGFVGSHPFLLSYWTDRRTHLPIPEYLVKTRARFGQWILDTAAAEYDQAWLDYQYEIGLRHHRSKKNQTDGVASVEHIPYRYLPAFIYPITATLKPFLGKKGHGPEDMEKVHQAWLKVVILHIALWSQPYVKEGDF
jgi:hypothetical protein